MYTFVISIIILFLIVVSSNYKSEYENNVIIDKKLTSQLKGIAIIFVLLGHMTISNLLDYKSIENFGAFGVDIFLLLSGYGLYKSYLKKGITKNFVIKRISTIYIPFIIVVLIEIFLKIYKQNYNFTFKQISVFLSGFDINRTLDGTYWYISFILLWYFIFCIIYKYSKSRKFNIILLFCISCLFKLSTLIDPLKSLSWQYSLHYITFPIGVLIATYEKEFMKVLVSIIYKLMIIILFITSFCTRYIFNLNDDFYWLYDLNIALLMLAIFIFFQSLGIMSRFLNFTGHISFEIYLVEIQILTYFNFSNIIGNKIIGDIIYIICCFIVGFILNRLVKVIKQLMFNKIDIGYSINNLKSTMKK